MAFSKFTLTGRHAKSASSSSLVVQEPATAREDRAAPRAEVTKTKSTPMSSCLSIFSLFIPTSNTDSKTSKEQNSTVLRKQQPAPYEQYTRPASNGHSSQRSPSPQPAPRSVSPHRRRLIRLRRPDSPDKHEGVLRAASSCEPETSAEKDSRPRAISLAPQNHYTSAEQMRAVTSPMSARPESPYSPYSDEDTSGGKISKRRSWLPGGGRKSRNASQDLGADSPAWIESGNGKLDYSLKFLVKGERVWRPRWS